MLNTECCTDYCTSYETNGSRQSYGEGFIKPFTASRDHSKHPCTSVSYQRNSKPFTLTNRPTCITNANKVHVTMPTGHQLISIQVVVRYLRRTSFELPQRQFYNRTKISSSILLFCKCCSIKSTFVGNKVERFIRYFKIYWPINQIAPCVSQNFFTWTGNYVCWQRFTLTGAKADLPHWYILQHRCLLRYTFFPFPFPVLLEVLQLTLVIYTILFVFPVSYVICLSFFGTSFQFADVLRYSIFDNVNSDNVG